VSIARLAPSAGIARSIAPRRGPRMTRVASSAAWTSSLARASTAATCRGAGRRDEGAGPPVLATRSISNPSTTIYPAPHFARASTGRPPGVHPTNAQGLPGALGSLHASGISSAPCMPAARKSPPRTPPPLPFEVRASPIQGLGVFATRPIAKGARLIEYVGERISTEEADERYDDDAREHHHTFLFAVGDDEVIDASVNGNEARFINHSCDPNCEAVDEDGRIFIEAIKDIEPGAELGYDYSLERDEQYQAHWATLYACRCGAARCRGTMLKAKAPARKRARGPAKKKAVKERTKSRARG
jgi:hypothetical protein